MSPYRRILLATDFSSAAEKAYPIARALAEVHGATLVLGHAFDTAQLAYDAGKVAEVPPETLVEGELESRLEHALKEAAGVHFAGLPKVETRLRLDGSPAHALVEMAEREQADLLILASHGRTGLAYVLIGSVAERLVRHAPCSVLVVPTRGLAPPGLPRRILVGSDLSAYAEAALGDASLLARASAARTTLLHVRRPIPWVDAPSTGEGSHTATGSSADPRAQLERSALHHFADMEVDTRIIEAESAVDALCREAEATGAELIVVASHGRTGLARMLVGSVAERTVRHAPCAVLVVRTTPPG